MKKVLLTLVVALSALFMAQPASAAAAAEEGEGFNPKEIIFHHLGDVYGWEVPFSHSHRIPLPIIARDCSGSWHVFSSSRVTDGGVYEGLYIAKEGEYANKLVGDNAEGVQYRPLDLSITKDVAALLIAALVVLLMVMSIVRWYKKHGMKAPRRWTASFEFLVEFIYLGVIRPTM